MKRIKIAVGNVQATAALKETETAGAICDNLPLKATANTWGDEIYFSIPVECEPEDPQEVVELGDLGYWPPGKAFCIFFGPTPASSGDEIRPASAVNVFGKVEGDPKVFKAVPSGAEVSIEKVQ